ncbi:hypothetical protein CERZMDRAFT_41205 [Cercospora zeae-maydis SCOH1-5]|uniref:Biogenesis of lysosome-related organelles complex 1 subunit CNL1 n=1 Tax=Cercospora zeae-maydis SCOH1-5 TaxID=717836 RepID=A0A6A6FFQ9_9PEZI|nr:hypothetical protein CERZMDRAFT_41205 [Cercospora zeae-maydis SCOH1-5]
MPPSSSHHHHHHHPRSPPSHPQQQQQQQQHQQTSASSSSSIADNRLGLSAQDVAALRQHQQLAHAQARSPAGSAASSQGRLLLDPGSLQLLSRHFDRIMLAIQQRLEQLNQATSHATQAQSDRAGNAIQMADDEIARFRAILAQMDELENEFEKIKRIRDIVRGFRARVEQMERRLG